MTGPSLARWCGACAAGELAGLCGSFALLAGARALGSDGFDQASPPLLRAGLGLLVGLFEGGLLGAAQAWALRPFVRGLSTGRLAAATAAPAALVWALVLGLMNASGEPGETVAEPPMAVIALVGALGGVSGGVLIGACQALAFAPLTGWRRARTWIVASATGWAAGLSVIMVATTLQDETTPVAMVAALAVLGAGLGGAALGLASHWGAKRLG